MHLDAGSLAFRLLPCVERRQRRYIMSSAKSPEALFAANGEGPLFNKEQLAHLENRLLEERS